MIIQLNQMNGEQITRYDELFTLACESISSEFKKLEIPNNYEMEISASTIERLLKCTDALNIPSSEHTLILNNVTKIIRDIETFISPNTLELMFPVLFFAAVLKNEFIPNTIVQRNQRGTMNWGKTKNLFENIENLFDHKNGDREKAFRNKCNELESLYSRYVNKRKENTNMLTMLDELARNVLMLKEHYADINRIQNQARIGLFALEILEAEHLQTTPMMTLARMQVIDQICKLKHFEEISNGFPQESVQVGNIISRYYYNNEPYMERQLSQRGLGFLRKAKKVDRIDSAKTSSVFDDENYEKLKAKSSRMLREELLFGIVLSDQEVKKIKDYYLDKSKLQWYADYYSKIMDHISDLIITLKNVTDIDDMYVTKDMYTAFLCKNYTND